MKGVSRNDEFPRRKNKVRYKRIRNRTRSSRERKQLQGRGTTPRKRTHLRFFRRNNFKEVKGVFTLERLQFFSLQLFGRDTAT